MASFAQEALTTVSCGVAERLVLGSKVMCEHWKCVPKSSTTLFPTGSATLTL
jgi:hypothetical protein